MLRLEKDLNMEKVNRDKTVVANEKKESKAMETSNDYCGPAIF